MKRKKRLTQDPAIVEKFMLKGLKSILYSEPSDSDSPDNNATEQVFLNATKIELDDKSTIKDDPDEFHSLLEAATVCDVIDTDILASSDEEKLHEISSVFVKQEVKDTFDNEVDIKLEPDDFDNINAGSPDFHDYSNPASPLAELIQPELTLEEIVKPPSPVAEQLFNVKKSNLVISEVHTLSAPITLSFNLVNVKKTRPLIVIYPEGSEEQLYISENGSLSPTKAKKAIPSKEKQKEFLCEAPNCGKSYTYRNEREQHLHGCHPELSNPEERGKRTCSFCLKFFSKVQHMKDHVDAEHLNVILNCKHCPKTFKIKHSLKKHFERSHQHKCPSCSQIFVSKDQLQAHWDIDHKDMIFPFLRVGEVSCNICNKVMATKGSLTRHKLEIHENIKKVRLYIRPCGICKEMLLGNYQKQKHMRDVHKSGEVLKRKCLLCNSEFDLYDDFKAHIETHKNVSICMTCGDHFPDELARFTHISTEHRVNKYNTLKKNISCDICGHRVAIKAQMDHHMRKHSKTENFYICDVCGKSYKFLPVRICLLSFPLELIDLTFWLYFAAFLVSQTDTHHENGL